VVALVVVQVLHKAQLQLPLQVVLLPLLVKVMLVVL
jgi:hypothetical protein